jgi:hypothetical protein
MYASVSAGAISTIRMSISTTSATHGTLGDNYVSVNPSGGSDNWMSIPQYRILVPTSQIVYLVVLVTGTTPTARGRISAVRVG